MTRRKAIIVLIALSLSLSMIPVSFGAVDEWVTGLCDEDLFIASYLFDGVDMVYLQGDEAQIRGWYWFEAPILMYGRYIKEAYLEVRTPSIGATDTSASMTIWGKPSGKGGTPSYYEDPNAINGPYTTNYYNVNLSSFVGPGVLHNITVTKILREINQGYYFWNGHDIAFVTLSTSNHDEERSVNSEESGYPAKLYIHYGVPEPGDPEYPPGLPEDAEYIETYRNYTIWRQNSTWIDLTLYSDATGVTVFSSTFANDTVYDSNDDARIRNETSDTAFHVKFGFEILSFQDTSPGAVRFFLMLFGYQESTGKFQVTTGDKLCMVLESDANLHRLQPAFYALDTDDDGYIDYGATIWSSFPMTRWVDMQYNNSDQTYSISIYTDKEMTNLEETISGTQDDGPIVINHEYVCNGIYANALPIDEGAYNIYSNFETKIYVIDENGTIVWEDTITDPDDFNTTEIEDTIDITIIGYPDPEDPNPPGWEDTGFTSLQMKLVFLVMGLVLFLGAPLYGFAERPDAATWILILFAMIGGIALLWSLQTM